MFNKLGVQLYTIRDHMQTEEDIRKSFKRLKDLGICQGQTAGCAVPYEIFGQIAKEENFEIVGTHDKFDIMRDDFDTAYKNHLALGTKIMGIGGFGCETAKDVENFIEDANKVAKKIGEKGGKFTYHHHSREFIKYEDGRSYMDILLEKLDFENASICFDTYWAQHGGADVRHWMEILSGKIDILHLKDMKKTADAQPICEIGNGNLYWEGILDTAEKTGVKYYVIEQDTNWIDGDPFKSLEISSNYLHKFMK